MAAEAGSVYVRMVHTRYRDPARGSMAALTGIGCLHVQCILSCRGRTVVAARTVTGHAAVIEGG